MNNYLKKYIEENILLIGYNSSCISYNVDLLPNFVFPSNYIDILS